MSKLILRNKDIENETVEVSDVLINLIGQTMSPKGGNVMYIDMYGNVVYSNDGANIIKNTSFEDPIQQQVLSLIRNAALATNTEAGDGTSSTVLLSSVLIKEGYKLLRNGWNQNDIRDEFIKVGNLMKTNLSKFTHEVKTDKDLFFIANVSSSNEKEIADNTVKTIKVVGKEGQVLINHGYTLETQVIEDNGFIMNTGIFHQDLAQNKSFQATYEDVAVFVTDKRLYYENEAEIILKTALINGQKNVVVVAADFIGDALPFFLENHQRGVINVLLIKEANTNILNDLAVYLGGEIVSDKSGTLDNLTYDSFTRAKMAYANQQKTIISREDKEQSKLLKSRIKEIKNQLKEIGDKSSKEYQEFEKRLASLTRGMVEIKVGGATPIEINEKIFRYEDAVNATRNSLEDGYVAGGGITLLNVWNSVDKKTIHPDIVRVFDNYSQSIIKQILTNCNESIDLVLQEIKNSKKDFGYNANTGRVVNMISAGVIEPAKVFTQVLDNSISIANALVTSNYRLVTKLEDKKEDK